MSSQGISLEIIKPALTFMSSLFKDRTPISFYFFTVSGMQQLETQL